MDLIARRGLVLAGLLLALSGRAAEQSFDGTAATEVQAQQKLEIVRAQLRALAEKQTQLDGDRGLQLLRLRNADRAVAAASLRWRELQAQRGAQATRAEEIALRRDAAESRLAAQRHSLAAVLRSIYAQGRHEQLKLLLSQDRVDLVARRLLYQRYLQRDRVARVESVLADLAALAQLEREFKTAQAQLDRLVAAAAEAEANLAKQRAEGRRLLAQIEADIKSGGERIAALGRDEQRLAGLLESLRDVFADIPRQLAATEAVLARRGRLPLPIAGRVETAFGQDFPDGRLSRGWWFSADAGSSVHAVAHGRVAYADWLKGYGLVLILDHGDGFLSLYAANETLLRGVGDWVESGDLLATAGSSGGQSRAGLYFELRRDGKPLDPQTWLAPR